MLIAYHAQSSRPDATGTRQWPLVLTLYLLLAVPGIPALLIILLLLGQAWLPAELLSLLNPVYLQTPAAILLHGGSGVLFFLTVPLQFSLRYFSSTSQSSVPSSLTIFAPANIEKPSPR